MLTEKRAFIFIMIISIVILIIPQTIRQVHFDNLVIGEEPYFHLKNAQDISEGIHSNDAYAHIIYFFGKYSNIPTAANLIPFILGILSTVILYLILKEYLSLNNRILALIFWIISPIFIFSYSVPSPFSVIVLINMLGVYILIKDKVSWLSILIIPWIVFFGRLNILITLIFIVLFAITHKNKSKVCLANIIIIFALTLYFKLYMYQLPFKMHSGQIFQENIASLGALFGFNIFALLLGAIGLIITWKKKKQDKTVYLAIIVVSLFSIFSNPGFKIFTNIFVSMFAAFGFISLLRMNWDLKLIKYLTILILVIGIVFTTVTHVYRLSFAEPTKITAESYEYLRSTSGEIVLSHKDNSYWIEYFSGKTAFISPFENNLTKENETKTIFMSRDEKKVIEFLNMTNISYIMVDGKTRQLMKNENNVIGLEFLMENSGFFKKLTRIGDNTVWEYKKSFT